MRFHTMRAASEADTERDSGRLVAWICVCAEPFLVKNRPKISLRHDTPLA